MKHIIVSALSYSNSRRVISSVIVLVLSLIFVLQTYMVENISEQFRIALSTPIAFRVISNSASKTNTVSNCVFSTSDLDAVLVNYIDCNYTDQNGTNYNKIALLTFLKDLSEESPHLYVREDLYDSLQRENNILTFSDCFAVLQNSDSFTVSGNHLIWKYDSKDYTVGSYLSGVQVKSCYINTPCALIASNNTFQSISSKEADEIYVVPNDDVGLGRLIRIYSQLKYDCDLDVKVVLTSNIGDYIFNVIKSCIIIIVGIANMIQIVFFVFEGRKKEFNILFLCGTTKRKIQLYRFVNLCLYVLPSVIIGFITFSLLSRTIWTDDYKFYEIKDWQMVMNIMLYLLFIFLAYLLYEQLNRREEDEQI